jgi:hypothetical protein
LWHYKRREFTYAQEARILSFGNASFSKPEDSPHFISLPWQIDVFKKIVVSPYASALYFEKVRDEVERLSAGLRAHIYLTNALEPASDAADTQIDALSEALAHEADGKRKVKRDT